MEKAAILHRPESEYAYLYEKDTVHLKIRTKKDDVISVGVLKGDPYLVTEDKWYRQELPMEKLYQTALYDYWFLETGAEFKRLDYAFLIEGIDGEVVFYGDRGFDKPEELVLQKNENYFRLPYFHEIDRVKTPEWVKETVWYQIFPERFANGDRRNDPKHTLPWGSKEHPDTEDFFGGDLQGVLDHLDYLQELGITGLYFCPIFTASSNHKYDTIDYFEIDPAFGDKVLFKTLVDEAHKRGMRIMLDAVFNHMGYYSFQWQDVVKNGVNSEFADWFYIHSFPVTYGENGNFEGAKTISYDTFSFTPMMPKLNTANSEVQEYLLNIATYWIKEFNIDAWRLDVANEVDHQFWKKFYHVTTEIKEDFYILGEIWHSSQNWLNGDEFHGVMNYAYTEAILDYFVKDSLDMEEFISRLYEQLALYRQQTNEAMFNMLDSHDTARIFTVAKENLALTQMTLAFMFIQHGAPCIYYGTEIGMTGENDPDCRKCMIWDPKRQNLSMFNFMRKLIQLRKDYHTNWSYGDFSLEVLDEKTGTISVKRMYQGELIVGVFSKKGYLYPLEENKHDLLLSNNTEEVTKDCKLLANGFVIYKMS